MQSDDRVFSCSGRTICLSYSLFFKFVRDNALALKFLGLMYVEVGWEMIN